MRFHKIVVTFFTAFFLLAILGTFSLYAEEELTKGKPALPGEACQDENLPEDWSETERCVWTRLVKGEIADFNKLYDIVLDPKELDPEKPEEWPENRILTPAFLETILLHEPYRGSLTHHGVQIVGAWFKDPIDLTNATLDHQLSLEGSRFDSKVVLDLLKTNHSISFKKSIFFKELILVGTKIDGQLDMADSKCIGKLLLDSLEVSDNLFMRGSAEFTEVTIVNVKIDSSLEMDGSKFASKLRIEALEVANSIFMRFKGAEFQEVDIYGAKIGGNLNLSGGTFKSFNLTNTIIGREFRLSSVHTNKEKDNLGAAKWLTKDSKLKLLNTKVGILQDSRNSWPENLELNGFTYDRLGKFIKEDGNDDTEKRDIKWLRDWMEKQKDYFPQPYEHLAKILRQDGRKKEARKILFASKLREHGEATNIWCWLWLVTPFIFIFICCRYYTRYNLYWFLGLGFVLLIIFAVTEIKYWVWLNAILILIGYGYHIDWALYWALVLVIIGTFVLWVSKQYREKDSNKKDLKYYGLAYSIDMLLPIIHLRKHHYDKIELEGWVRVYFYVHKILGYALALFIITGLSGIVK